MDEKPYYKFLGPLDPEDPKQVCNDREEDVSKVIQGINMDDYWMILGSRQVGKTTFLNLIKKKYEQVDYIYFDFEKTHSTEKEFYQELIKKILGKIPHKRAKSKNIKGDSPAMSFFDFLIDFKPKKEKKVIFLFDEIDGLPFLRSFLHLWRKVYHERHEEKGLYRYTVITTGSVDLVKLAIGPNSPFNIGQKLYLKDFSEEESKNIIEKPFAKLGIQIEPTAKQELLSQICGHPQLLQHACHILVENAKPGVKITENHVDEAIGRLLSENSVLETLKRNIANDETLKSLVHDLLIEKKQKIFHPYSVYALLGAGAIKEENSKCKIRNEVYGKLILDILNNPVDENRNKKIFICYSHKDEKWLERVLTHLKPLKRVGKIEPWTDKRIKAGAKWKEEIQKALNTAKIAILLISADFLASDFIENIELPTLLKNAEKRGTKILPLIVEPSLFKKDKNLCQFQSINNPDKPLRSLKKYERERELVKLAEIIEEYCND